MDFLLGITDWNLVSKVGLPKDGTWCFVVFGGMVVEGKDAVAWKSWDDVDFLWEQGELQ